MSRNDFSRYIQTNENSYHFSLSLLIIFFSIFLPLSSETKHSHVIFSFHWNFLFLLFWSEQESGLTSCIQLMLHATSFVSHKDHSCFSSSHKQTNEEMWENLKTHYIKVDLQHNLPDS